ncbi:alpha/beta fold hydrolase [Streptomyces candidus]|uniref:Pimeloyl-ACP methyl ester carboxylesterase n=1 Tax=Streptomyces candidus TaxID=67283 RepID=A0A7X0HKU7_9ACTN|nr:alpha/beta fold hydrolase [Streptomyces candidus]MBB6438217.1 pimeloyl-ACP methyl ester carboxylesterase [Streptomyces candidus]GHH38882.1 tripeptidyl aminopeptidase [Streptomyces candidus]
MAAESGPGLRATAAPPLPRARHGLALCAALVLALSACGQGKDDGDGGAATKPPTSSAPPAVPTPEADWDGCPLTGQATRECATLKVPVDAAHPGSGTLDLAVSRLPATDRKRRLGVLVMDPGGPGLQGRYTAANLLPPQLRALFDIVGFDRRGSGASTPVDCGEPAGAMRRLEETAPADLAKADPEAVEKSAREYVAKCRAKYGELTAHLGTADSVADLESLRLALGEDKLSLLTVSYGTLVAQEYLRTHPGRVRAAVLDGTADPAERGVPFVLSHSASLEEAVGTAGLTPAEKAARELRDRTAGFRSWCAASGPAECAIAPEPDEVLGAVAARTDHLLGAATAVMVTPADWPGFSRAVDKAQGTTDSGTASADATALADLKAYADKGFPRDVAKAVRNPPRTAAFDLGVHCADYAWPKTTEGVLKELGETARESGYEDAAPSYAALYSACPSWPRSRAPLGAIRAPAAPRPLAVNAEEDVRTPLAGAQAVAERLPAALLKVGGRTHGLARTGNPCVDAALTRTLVNGTPPKDGTCPAL